MAEPQALPAGTGTPLPHWRNTLRAALPALLLGAFLLWLAQAGYTGEDDAHYLFAADGWLNEAPFLGTTHWHLRHPHVFAIAGSFALFGRSEAAMMLPTVLAYLGVIVLTARLVGKVAGHRAAVLASLAFAATPVFVFYAKIPYPDVSELFWGVASFACFWTALDTGRLRWFVAAGLAMAMAWLIRSSTIPFIALYGLLFLAGFRAPRVRYLAMAVGFLPPVLIEWGYYAWRAGNPFYRFGIDMHSLEIPTAHMVGKVAHGLRPPFNAELMARWVPNSIVDVHWLVNPYIDFLTSPSFGPLYGLAAVAGLWLWRGAGPDGRVRAFAGVVALLAGLWIFSTIYVLNLRPQPRYFLPATWACCVLLGMAMAQVADHLPGRWWRRLAWAAFAGLLLVDVALVSARKDPMAAERDLVAYVADSPRPVTTDLVKARFLLEDRGMAWRVRFVSAPYPAGADGIVLVGTDTVPRWQAAGWRVAMVLASAPSPADRLWNALLPAGIAARLRASRGVAVIVPAGAIVGSTAE